jgi:hypothetical protein
MSALSVTILVAALFTGGSNTLAQSAAVIPPSLVTPDKVETRIGTLDFKDGMPGKDTLAKVYDNLDFTHAFEAFVNTMQGVNAEAIRKGFADIGAPDNEVLVFSELMDAKSRKVALSDGQCGHRLFRRRD